MSALPSTAIPFGPVLGSATLLLAVAFLSLGCVPPESRACAAVRSVIESDQVLQFFIEDVLERWPEHRETSPAERGRAGKTDVSLLVSGQQDVVRDFINRAVVRRVALRTDDRGVVDHAGDHENVAKVSTGRHGFCLPLSGRGEEFLVLLARQSPSHHTGPRGVVYFCE